MYIFKSDPVATETVYSKSHNSKCNENNSQTDYRHAHSRLSTTSRVDIALPATTARTRVVGNIIRLRSNSQRRPIEVPPVVVIYEEKVGRASPGLRAVLYCEMRASVHGIVRIGRVQLHDVRHQYVSHCAVGESDRHVEVVVGEVQSVLGRGVGLAWRSLHGAGERGIGRREGRLPLVGPDVQQPWDL
jgi:hypothetical protein